MRQVTVLGSCGGFPEPGRACSGFLVSWDGFRVVLDLGYATLPRLMAAVPDGAVDAVMVTHEHPDHCIDLHGLFRMLLYRRVRVPLYCPPGVVSRLAGLQPEVGLDTVFDVHPLPGMYEIGPFAVTSEVLPHGVANAGIRLAAHDAVLAYTGDCGPSELLADLGRDADLFIVEATHRDADIGSQRGKLKTARDAGEAATRAGARQLLLCHFWPGSDRAAFVADARTAYDGDVIAAQEDLVVAIVVR